MFDTIVDGVAAFLDFINLTLSSITDFFSFIPDTFLYLKTLIQYLPPVLIPFALVSVLLSIMFLILNRNRG